MKLIEVLARSLGSEPLDELVASVVACDLAELTASATDVVFCWWVRGLPVPESVVERVRAALISAPASHRTAFAWMLGETPALPQRPDGGWEAISQWAMTASPLALPGLAPGFFAGCEEDLIRGVGLAHLLRNPSLAGRLLRWLVLAVPADVVRTAIEDSMRFSRTPSDGHVATRIAIAVQQRANVASGSLEPRAQPATPVLSAERRHALVDRAVGWVERHLDRFAVRSGTADVRALHEYKAAGELALVSSRLIDAGEREGHDDWRTRGTALRDFARLQVGDGERIAEMIEAAPALAAFVTMLPSLHRAGLRNARLDAAIVQHAPRLGTDLAYLVGTSMRAIGLASPWDLEVAWQWTRVVDEPTPWLLEAPQLYLLLHEVWARADQSWPDDRGRAYITRWLPVWMRYMEICGHHDLLAETILTWHALHGTPAPEHAWDVLIRAQRDDGAIPTTRPNVQAGTAVMTDEYHATLNAIWAAASQPASALQ